MDASLLAALQSPDAATRAAAAERLAHLGGDARDAAVALAQSAGDADENVREWAIAALEELGPPPAAAVGEFALLLRGDSRATAYWAATLLGRLGPAAAPATPQLSAAVAAGDPHVQQRAAWALGKIGPPAVEAISALEVAATSADARLARLAGEALAAIRT